MSIPETGRLHRLLNWLRPHFDIRGPDGSVYMHRWYLVRLGWLRLNLHHIRRPDSDLLLHDHPWDFALLILRGGYLEQVGSADSERAKYFGHTVGRIVRRNAEFAHRIAFVPRCGAWTLVFIGRTRREWGFWTEAGWKPWREYLGIPASNEGEAGE